MTSEDKIKVLVVALKIALRRLEEVSPLGSIKQIAFLKKVLETVTK